MDKKVVLITGGSSGIGRAIGNLLKAKEFIVYGTTRNLSKNSDFTDFNLVSLNVHESTSIELAVASVIEKEGQLDILINNAGVGITGPIEETPDQEIEKAFNTNLYGPIRVSKAVIPQMRKQKNGLIINITSIAAYMGLPYRGIYSASKAALEIVTETMRMETKDFGIKITNLAPGDFATNIAAGRYHVPITDNSPYKKAYGDTLEIMNKHVDSGQNPIEVAKEVYKIINTSKPGVHYKVGDFMQKFSILLKKILPSKMYERILLNHYKL